MAAVHCQNPASRAGSLEVPETTLKTTVVRFPTNANILHDVFLLHLACVGQLQLGLTTQRMKCLSHTFAGSTSSPASAALRVQDRKQSVPAEACACNDLFSMAHVAE